MSRIIVVQTLVLSLFDYCIGIWGTASDTVLSSAQKLQSFAARVAMGGVRKYDHISPTFNKLKWLRLKQRHVFDVCTTVFKVLQGFYPELLLTIKSTEAVNNSTTRQRHSLYVPRTNTNYGDRRTEVLRGRLWNALPPSLTSSSSLSTFKSGLRNFLLTKN